MIRIGKLNNSTGVVLTDNEIREAVREAVQGKGGVLAGTENQSERQQRETVASVTTTIAPVFQVRTTHKNSFKCQNKSQKSLNLVQITVDVLRKDHSILAKMCEEQSYGFTCEHGISIQKKWHRNFHKKQHLRPPLKTDTFCYPISSSPPSLDPSSLNRAQCPQHRPQRSPLYWRKRPPQLSKAIRSVWYHNVSIPYSRVLI